MTTHKESAFVDCLTIAIFVVLFGVVTNEVIKRVSASPREPPQALNQHSPIPPLVNIIWR